MAKVPPAQPPLSALCPTPASPFWEKSLELPQSSAGHRIQRDLLHGLSFSCRGVLERWETDDFGFLKKVENEDIFWVLILRVFFVSPWSSREAEMF